MVQNAGVVRKNGLKTNCARLKNVAKYMLIAPSSF